MGGTNPDGSYPNSLSTAAMVAATATATATATASVVALQERQEMSQYNQVSQVYALNFYILLLSRDVTPCIELNLIQMNAMSNQYGMQYNSNQRMTMMSSSMGMGMMNNMNPSKIGPQVHKLAQLTLLFIFF